MCRKSAGETYGEGLHLLDDLVSGGGHGDDTTAGDGLGAHEGGAESLGGGGVRNLRDGMGRKKRKRKKGGKNVCAWSVFRWFVCVRKRVGSDSREVRAPQQRDAGTSERPPVRREASRGRG